MVTREKKKQGFGTSWSWEPGGATVPWSWQEMVAQLTDESIELLVTGLDVTSNNRGLVGCRLVECEKPDQHRRNAAIEKQANEDKMAEAEQRPPVKIPQCRADGEPWKIWNFELTCEDGKVIHLHPHYSTPKIDCLVATHTSDHEVPRNGPGVRGVPGTHQWFAAKNKSDIDLRFHAGIYPAGLKSAPEIKATPPPKASISCPTSVVAAPKDVDDKVRSVASALDAASSDACWSIIVDDTMCAHSWAELLGSEESESDGDDTAVADVRPQLRRAPATQTHGTFKPHEYSWGNSEPEVGNFGSFFGNWGDRANVGGSNPKQTRRAVSDRQVVVLVEAAEQIHDLTPQSRPQRN